MHLDPGGRTGSSGGRLDCPQASTWVRLVSHGREGGELNVGHDLEFCLSRDIQKETWGPGFHFGRGGCPSTHVGKGGSRELYVAQRSEPSAGPRDSAICHQSVRFMARIPDKTPLLLHH